MATFNDPNVDVMGTLSLCTGTKDNKTRSLSVVGSSVGGTLTGSLAEACASITAGTVQTRAGATAITTDVVSVTVGNASDGVVLPAATLGRQITIVNVSNAAGKVYAAGSDTVNLAAGSTGVALTTGSTTGSVTYAVCASAGSWTLK